MSVFHAVGPAVTTIIATTTTTTTTTTTNRVALLPMSPWSVTTGRPQLITILNDSIHVHETKTVLGRIRC